MGNTLSEVVEYRESKLYYDIALFAKCDISAGGILKGDDNVHRGLMNPSNTSFTLKN